MMPLIESVLKYCNQLLLSQQSQPVYNTHEFFLTAGVQGAITMQSIQFNTRAQHSVLRGLQQLEDYW